jgi:septum formation protein
MSEIILASSSPNRKQLLERILTQFSCIPPHIDESRRANESPRDLAVRLAREKAEVIAKQFPDAVVIGSDQVPALGDQVFDKPLTHARAVEQLSKMSEHTVEFITGVCVIGPHGMDEFVDVTEVEFIKLTPKLIENYLSREEALNCAGGLRSEGLGISLMKRMHCEDPTALIGLPLIQLCQVLRNINALQ